MPKVKCEIKRSFQNIKIKIETSRKIWNRTFAASTEKSFPELFPVSVENRNRIFFVDRSIQKKMFQDYFEPCLHSFPEILNTLWMHMRYCHWDGSLGDADTYNDATRFYLDYREL